MLSPGRRNLDEANIARARRLRDEMGVSERALWAILRKERLGFKFRRQHPIGPYVLDFYCAEAMLCVEVDGEIHRTKLDADARRDRFLSTQRVATYRIPSLELFGDTPTHSAHVRAIVSLCEERSGRVAFPD